MKYIILNNDTQETVHAKTMADAIATAKILIEEATDSETPRSSCIIYKANKRIFGIRYNIEYTMEEYK